MYSLVLLLFTAVVWIRGKYGKYKWPFPLQYKILAYFPHSGKLFIVSLGFVCLSFWFRESNSGPWTCQAGAVPLVLIYIFSYFKHRRFIWLQPFGVYLSVFRETRSLGWAGWARTPSLLILLSVGTLNLLVLAGCLLSLSSLLRIFATSFFFFFLNSELFIYCEVHCIFGLLLFFCFWWELQIFVIYLLTLLIEKIK